MKDFIGTLLLTVACLIPTIAFIYGVVYFTAKYMGQ